MFSRPCLKCTKRTEKIVIVPVYLCSSGEGHKTRRCRRVTYPESYITKHTTYTKTSDKLDTVQGERAKFPFA